MYSEKRRVFGNLASPISKTDLLSIKSLSEKYKMKIFEEAYSRIYTPCSIFDNSLSSLEAIVRYLRDSLGFSNSDVAHILHRKANTVTTTYQKATSKYGGFMDEKSEYQIPVSIFCEGALSVLENICLYLKLEYKLSNKDIAAVMKLDSKTVWTVLSRAEKKLK